MKRSRTLIIIAVAIFIISIVVYGASQIRLQTLPRNGWTTPYYLTHDTTYTITWSVSDTTSSTRLTWAFIDTVMAGMTLRLYVGNVPSDSVIIDTLTALNILADINSVRSTTISNDSLFSLWLPGGLTADSSALWALHQAALTNTYAQLRVHIRKGNNPGTITVIQD